jgi:hypothetical protein
MTFERLDRCSRVMGKKGLKGHTNETYFSIFLYISVQHRSLTLLIKFFQIQTHGDICI